jgi:chromosome segregation ATPase
MDSKVKSLKWAIGELSKQKGNLEGKLKVARKRDETSALIEEVHAQKDALEKRIASLQEGLKASSDLVDEKVNGLSDTISTVDEKLEIAQERLESLEQEEYLEELGRKLNGDYSTEDSEKLTTEDAADVELPFDTNTFPASFSPAVSTQPSTDVQMSPTPVIMKSSSNRIETEEEETAPSSRIEKVEESPSPSGAMNLKLCQDITASSLEDCAKELGMEPEFLLNKGMQAVLRMIARNGNQISFPLEVEQVK